MKSTNIKNFWKNKKVLITGHNGFKGTWLSIWLNHKKAKIIGYSLTPTKYQQLFIKSKIDKKIININGNVKNKTKLFNVINKYKPSIIFHLASQPLVIESYKNPTNTIETNLNGTLNLLEVCRKLTFVESIIIVTSDKCYENIKDNKIFLEDDKLGGLDPYSCSKSLTELLVRSYSNSFFNDGINNITVASARSGNVIGGGDLSKNRLVPDAIKAFNLNKTLILRNPNSIRPWQHILDTLNGYILLAEKITKYKKKYSGAWNFGPDYKNIKTVELIAKKIKINWHKKTKSKIIIKKNKDYEESKAIRLNCNKAKKYLKWSPKLNIDDAIKFTIDWHKNNKLFNNTYNQCIKQIKIFEKIK